MTPQERFLRAKDFLKSSLPEEGGEAFSIGHMEWHHRDWEDILSLVPDLKRHLRALWQTRDFIPDFYEDLFNLLMQGLPMLTPDEQMRDDHEVTHK